jgi:copper chaperone CopZ
MGCPCDALYPDVREFARSYMSVSTTYQVSGMTCRHCVNAVREELSALPGVGAVDVDLHSGEVSLVTVTSQNPLAEADVEAAIDEAGYHFAGVV